jgi:hypothetical protein
MVLYSLQSIFSVYVYSADSKKPPWEVGETYIILSFNNL